MRLGDRVRIVRRGVGGDEAEGVVFNTIVRNGVVNTLMIDIAPVPE